MDLCKSKKFINLDGDLFLYYKDDKLVSLLDSNDIFWKRERKIEEGGSGEVIEFKSGSKEYTDLAIKFFFNYEKEKYFIEKEIYFTNFFINRRCRNFIKTGVKTINNGESVVIMEKVDGDLLSLEWDKFKNPKYIFNEFVKFLADGYKCALSYNKYFLDIKEENLGYKICDDSIKFTFLDFGSFSEKDDKYVSVTNIINRNAHKKCYFSNEMYLVYGTIITLLILRLKVAGKKYGKSFEKFIFEDLETRKRYPKTNLLLLQNYEEIKEHFYKDFHRDDEFINLLFKFLHSLTKEEPNVESFIRKIDCFY